MIFEEMPADFDSVRETAVCFIECKGKFLLLHRQDYKPEGGKWGFVGGKIDDGEDAFGAIKREVVEETGISLKNPLYLKKLFVRYPDHDFVYYWNKGLNMDVAPAGVKTEDKGYIKDAWLKILAVMPSVIENDTLFCSDNGKVLAKYDYHVEIPTKTVSGDCRTDYIPLSENAELNTYLNDQILRKGELNSFTTNEDASFKAVLNIQQDTRIDHYKWKTYCCKENRDCYKKYCKIKRGDLVCYRTCKPICESYCRKCSYAHTEIKKDDLTLTDTLEAKYYDKKPELLFKVS